MLRGQNKYVPNDFLVELENIKMDKKVNDSTAMIMLARYARLGRESEKNFKDWFNINNRRGMFNDLAVILIIVFVLSFGLFILSFFVNTGVGAILSHSEINESAAAAQQFQNVVDQTSKYDYMFFMMFVGLIILTLITSWFIGGHPIFMFLYILVGIIMVVIAPALSNTWEDITVSGGAFGTTIAGFPMTNHILLNLPFYIAVIAFIGMVIMFAKPVLVEGGA